jgi:hypothetical protein
MKRLTFSRADLVHALRGTSTWLAPGTDLNWLPWPTARMPDISAPAWKRA